MLSNFNFITRNRSTSNRRQGYYIRLSVNKASRSYTQFRIVLSPEAIRDIQSRQGDRFSIGVKSDLSAIAVIPDDSGYKLTYMVAKDSEKKEGKVSLSITAPNHDGIVLSEPLFFNKQDVVIYKGGFILQINEQSGSQGD